MSRTQLSAHFYLDEFEQSQTATRFGIDNRIPESLRENVKAMADFMERCRTYLGKPIAISSGYRGPALNKKVGGSTRSAHMDARAVDFTCPAFGTPEGVARFLAACPLPFDQLIYEGTWVHISIPEQGEEPRKMVMTAKFKNGKASYSTGIAGYPVKLGRHADAHQRGSL